MWARGSLPAGSLARVVVAYTAPVRARASQGEKGERDDLEGRDRSLAYTPARVTMVAQLEITAGGPRRLDILIHDAERRECDRLRKSQARRATSTRTAADWAAE